MFKRSPHRIIGRRGKSKGFTAIELLAVLAVVGIILVVAWPRIKQMFTSGYVTNEIGNVNILKTNIKSLYSATPNNYTGLTDTIMVNAQMIPTNMEDGSTPPNIVSPWGSITLGTATSNTQFTITYAGIPAEDCARFASETYAGFQSLIVGSTTITSPSDASTACSGAGPFSFVFTDQ